MDSTRTAPGDVRGRRREGTELSDSRIPDGAAAPPMISRERLKAQQRPHLDLTGSRLGVYQLQTPQPETTPTRHPTPYSLSPLQVCGALLGARVTSRKRRGA